MIVLFDGVCHLCTRSVQFLLRRDREAILRFASLQSQIGRELLEKYGVPVQDPPGSIVLIRGGQAYTESEAALRILMALGGPWKLTFLLLGIPSFLRDWVYQQVASNRYRWFGKDETCWIPEPGWKERFLDASETPPLSKSP